MENKFVQEEKTYFIKRNRNYDIQGYFCSEEGENIFSLDISNGKYFYFIYWFIRIIIILLILFIVFFFVYLIDLIYGGSQTFLIGSLLSMIMFLMFMIMVIWLFFLIYNYQETQKITIFDYQGKTLGELKIYFRSSKYVFFNHTNNVPLIKLQYKKKNAEITYEYRSLTIKERIIVEGNSSKKSVATYSIMDQQIELAKFEPASYNDLIFSIRTFTNNLELLLLYIFGITTVWKHYCNPNILW